MLRLFSGSEEYFSFEEYADELMQSAIENKEEYIVVDVYATGEDKAHRENPICGFVLYRPDSSEQICTSIRNLVQYI